jgi:phage antirepressor YoqD-like protein
MHTFNFSAQEPEAGRFKVRSTEFHDSQGCTEKLVPNKTNKQKQKNPATYLQLFSFYFP